MSHPSASSSSSSWNMPSSGGPSNAAAAASAASLAAYYPTPRGYDAQVPHAQQQAAALQAQAQQQQQQRAMHAAHVQQAQAMQRMQQQQQGHAAAAPQLSSSAMLLQQQQQSQQQQSHGAFEAGASSSPPSSRSPSRGAGASTNAAGTSTPNGGFERPRVRTDGPGGPDVKQGARIACLDCRTAKIRCSAPTDGIVPCKRCARHDKECIFEKHRRGRKPGRWNGSGPPQQRDDSGSPQPEGEHGAVSSAAPLQPPSASLAAAASATAMAAGQFAHHSSQWTQPAAATSRAQPVSYHATSAFTPASSNARMPSPGRNGSRPPYGNAGSSPQLGSSGSFSSYTALMNGLPSPSSVPSLSSAASAPSLRSAAWPGPISMPPPTRLSSAATLEHHTPGTAQVPRSWLDFASPGRSLLSPSLGLGASPGMLAASAAYVAQQTQQAIGLPGAQSLPLTSQSNGTGQSLAHASLQQPFVPVNQQAAKRKGDEPAAQKKEDGEYGSAAKRARLGEEADETAAVPSSGASEGTSDDAEVDQLDEDALGEGQDEDVLQTPLRLLAHASEGMAATKAGEQKGSTGAATMGLVSPPARTRSRPSMLSHLVAAAGGQHPIRTLPTLPGIGTLRASSNVRTLMSPPFGLPRPGAAGRSRSYTAGEGAQSQARVDALNLVAAAAAGVGPATAAAVADLERPAAAAAELEAGSTTPSTRDAGAWEYRGGKSRTRASARDTPTSSSVAAPREGSEGRSDPITAVDDAKAGETDATGSDSPLLTAAAARNGSSGSSAGNAALSARRKSMARAARPRSRMTNEDGSASLRIDGDASVGAHDDQEAGASHPDYWTQSPFASKLDVEQGDPVELGFIEMSELRDLFDIFFARINPLLNLLDPFLHSVSYTRSRSALLTTVIAAFAARLSDSPRDAELAVLMERHWRSTLVPEVLLGGYKSVELSQAFLLLSLYGKPTQRLSDDRSWQYLGFACRIATEIGINRRVAPSGSLQDSEQLRRRIRNRWRTWMCLFISDRTLSAQTGRPFTISEDDLIAGVATNFHRADWALPQDVSLVALIQLRRLIAQHEEAFNTFLHEALGSLLRPRTADADPSAPVAVSIAGLELYRKTANADLERWRDSWCISATDEARVQSLAMADFLVRWRPTAMLHYEHARLYLNSIILQAFEQYNAGSGPATELASPVTLDCWSTATRLIDVLLDDISQEQLESSPNQTAIMATWAALAALRLTKLDPATHPWVDRDAIVSRAKRLAIALARAGRSPAHRNGAAGPYGSYLRTVVMELFAPAPSDDEDVKAEDTLETEPKASSPQEPAPAAPALPEKKRSSDDNLPTIASADVLAANALPAVNGSLASPVELSMADASSALRSSSLANARLGTGLRLDALPVATAANSIVETSTPLAGFSSDVWAAAGGPDGAGVFAAATSAEPENIDLAFDYLTAFEGSGGFPGGLWTPQTTWGGNGA